MTESLFGLLAGRHPNLLAVKLDGATKELFVWGLRCGFITFGPGDAGERRGRLRGARRQDARRDPRRALEQPDVVADARREGARHVVDRGRAQGEGRDAARACRPGLRGREAPGVPRELRALPVQQRLLHVREGEGRRRREAARAPARCAPDRSDRDQPDRHPRGVLVPRDRPDRTALRDAPPGDPGAQGLRAPIGRRQAVAGARRAQHFEDPRRRAMPRSRFSTETRSFGPWMPRVSLGGSQRGTNP